MTEGHGDDLYRYGGRIRVNFSTNIWQHADHEPLRRFMASRLDFVTSYPEPEPYRLERRIASRHGLRDEEVMATAGVTDAIYTIARNIAAGGRNGIVGPTFSEYADACCAAGGDPKYFDNAADAAAVSDTVWICNPNNPDGRVMAARALVDLIMRWPSVTFVVDTAYADYCMEPRVDIAAMARLDNAVMLHSLTKQCCVPGLRVGYVTACAGIISRLRRHRMPWAVNALAADCAEFLIENPPFIPVDMILSESRRIQHEIAGMGYEVTPSETNFFLCRMPRGSAGALKEWLVESRGMLIRDASNFSGLTSGHFRIAAQRPEENDILLDQLKIWARKYC